MVIVVNQIFGTYYKVNDIVPYGGQAYAAIVGPVLQVTRPPTTTINVTVDMDTGPTIHCQVEQILQQVHFIKWC